MKTTGPGNVNTRIDFSSASFKKYFANTSWLFAEKMARLLLTFAIGVYMVRYLGPADFGLYSYALSFVGLFSTIATLGLESIVVRELVKTPARRDVLLGSVFRLRLIGAALTLALIAVAVVFVKDTPLTIVMILVLGAAPAFQSLTVIDGYFQSRVTAKFSVSVNLTVLIAGSALKLLLIAINAPVLWFAIETSAESIIQAAGFWYMYRREGLRVSGWTYEKGLAKTLLKDSWPLILSGVVISIYVKIGQVLIKHMLSDKDIGMYAAAVRLCEAWYFIPTAVTASLFPSIVNAKAISEELYMSRLQKLYDVMAWVSILIALPVSVFSELIVVMLFGKAYAPAAPVLSIYIWAGVATFLGVASSQYLIAENLTRISFYRTLMGMVINVLLNLLLIPRLGITGSALATLISFSIATFSIAISRKTFPQLWMMIKAMLFLDAFKFIYTKWQSRS